MNITTNLNKKEKLTNEIERTTAANTLLEQKIAALETAITQKKSNKQNLIQKLDQCRLESAEPVSERKDIENNIQFLKTEKSRLTHEYQSIKSSLDKNLHAIDTMLKDLGFIKGEIATLIDQVSILEEELPVRIRDADNLDDKITRSTANAITSLYKDMKEIENRAKMSYYKKFKEWDDIRSTSHAS
jgi:chromosome segregation ATPase